MTPYLVSESGTKAELPARCPYAEDGRSCRIGLHFQRERKTGPEWGWVAVARCRMHERAFTVYPPGHVPYGRQALVVIGPDGSEVRPTDGAAALAGAAADARDDKLWPRDSAEDGVRTTQRRYVRALAAILGVIVGGVITPALAAAVLHLPEGRLVETAQRVAGSPSVVELGKEVSELLAALARRGGRWLVDRMAVLGHLARWWGRPWRWVPRLGQLLALGEPYRAALDAIQRERSPPS